MEPREKHIAFCYDGRSLLDERYNGHIRDLTGISGWGEVNDMNITKIFNNVYWFYTYNQKYRLHQAMKRKKYQSPDTWKVAIKQTLFTLNGLMIKRILTYPDLFEHYELIAKQTACLFRELLANYMQDADSEDNGIYKNIKEYCQHVKRNFHANEPMVRLGALTDFKFKHRSIMMFFPERTRLYDYIIDQWNDIEEDYTLSSAWMLRMTTFCQTRILGYLPIALSRQKGKEYRSRLVEQRPELSRDLMKELHKEYIKEIEEHVPRGLLTSVESTTYEFKSVMEKAINIEFHDNLVEMVSFNIEQTASVTKSVAMGGKLEDARQYLQLMKRNKWKIPVRDLDSFKIKYFLTSTPEDIEMGFQAHLFWFALQNLLNALIEAGIMPKDLTYRFILSDGKEFEPTDLFSARIAIIREPGKDRYLTMSHSLYTWSLLPAGKILNAALALHPVHRVGLKGAGDGWEYSRALDPGGEDSGFLYDGKTPVFQFFTDWKEATDTIHKSIGKLAVNALCTHIEFPRAYKDFILKMLSIVQNATQMIRYSDVEEDIRWSGPIRNGFMMGNPITKTILHSMHILTDALLHRRIGRPIKSNPHGLRRPQLFNREEIKQPKIVFGKPP